MSREIDALVASEVLGIWPKGRRANMSVPHYSTDIVAAWEVVEKMGGVNTGGGFCLDISFDGGWIVNIGNHNSTDEESAPTAICLAALKAKGVADVPEQD